MKQQPKRSVGRPRKILEPSDSSSPEIKINLRNIPVKEAVEMLSHKRTIERVLRAFANDLEEIMGDSRDFFTLRAAITSLMNDRGLYTKPVTTTND